MTKIQNEMFKFNRQWFFAVEATSKTSPKDVEEFSALLEDVCKRYNLKWCQAVWKPKRMKRKKEEE